MPQHRAAKRRRPPFFHPAVLRARRDGWTAARQAAFLGHLYLTGCAAAAARAVGMSRMAAYRLRRDPRASGFAWAWDVVLTPSHLPAPEHPPYSGWKVTDRQLASRVDSGFVAPLIFRGKVCAIRRKADNSALLQLLSRIDRYASRRPEEGHPA